jgi:hypothetical protein
MAALAVATLVSPVYTQGRGGQAPARPAAKADWPPKLEMPAAGEVEILPVQGNVYMIAGAGGNITVQVGDQGVMMIDTGTAAMSEKVMKAVQSLAKGKAAALHRQHEPSRRLHRRQRQACGDRRNRSVPRAGLHRRTAGGDRHASCIRRLDARRVESHVGADRHAAGARRSCLA